MAAMPQDLQIDQALHRFSLVLHLWAHDSPCAIEDTGVDEPAVPSGDLCRGGDLIQVCEVRKPERFTVNQL